MKKATVIKTWMNATDIKLENLMQKSTGNVVNFKVGKNVFVVK
jgi:hypothetical protein